MIKLIFWKPVLLSSELQHEKVIFRSYGVREAIDQSERYFNSVKTMIEDENY